MSGPDRLRLAAVVTALAAGCGSPSTTVTTDLAVGWEGRLYTPLVLSNCDEPAGGQEIVVRTEGQWFRAAAPGEVRHRCGDDTWIVRVATPVRYHVEAPSPIAVGERSGASLHATGADGRRLSLGGYAAVEWTFAGAIQRSRPLPHDFIGAAINLILSNPHVGIQGVHPGRGTITATSLREQPISLSATVTVTAAPAGQGSR